MNSNKEHQDLTPIWAEMGEALEILRGFADGSIKEADAKETAKRGVRYLSRARESLGKLVDITGGG